MNFKDYDLTPRTLAFAPELVEQLPDLVARFGAPAFDAGLRASFNVVLARWDDTARTRLRAAALCNEEPVKLTDGRLAICGAIFSKTLLAAVTSGKVAAEEIDMEKLNSLRASRDDV